MNIIVSAAMKHPISDVIICSPRHWDKVCRDVYGVMNFDAKPEYTTEWIQGFVDTHGKFLTRKEAWVVAWTNRQIIKMVGNQEQFIQFYIDWIPIPPADVDLYSENLY